MEPASRQTALYKAYHEGTLVYVGVSKSVLRRVSEHLWVDPTNVKIELFATRGEAEAEERRLIADKGPFYNIMHNEHVRRRRSARLAKKVHRGDAAEILKRARRLAKMTQVEMANRLGTSQQVISLYETG